MKTRPLHPSWAWFWFAQWVFPVSAEAPFWFKALWAVSVLAVAVIIARRLPDWLYNWFADWNARKSTEESP